ncbi:MAG: PLP-dependent cysteine synthase family protein, partial [Candidatus Thorarchaeota archaeon]
MKVYDSILDTIGNTPLVKLRRMNEGLRPTIVAKVEYFNPGGSVKDRIGIAMIEDAEKRGLLNPGDTIVEPTSGNTGIGLALAAIVKGYKMIVTIPDKMSHEKIALLRSLCAQVIITPTDVEPDDPESYVKVAERITEENDR